MLGGRRRKEEDLRRSFWKNAAAWDQTGKKGECLCDKLWNRFQSNDTKGKHLLNDLDAVLAKAVENVWLRESSDVARIWMSTSKLEG